MGIRSLCQFVWSGDYGTLCQQARSGHTTPEGDPETADCVLGFAFGRVGHAPGISNEQLAHHARRYFPSLPGIFQQEVADAYAALAPTVSVLSITRHRQPGKYLDTREVADQARLLMEQHGWRVAVLLAQGHHMPRALRVCRRLGLCTVVPTGLERIPFCPDSSQPWTRSAGAWARRERLVLLHHAWKGWL